MTAIQHSRSVQVRRPLYHPLEETTNLQAFSVPPRRLVPLSHSRHKKELEDPRFRTGVRTENMSWSYSESQRSGKSCTEDISRSRNASSLSQSSPQFDRVIGCEPIYLSRSVLSFRQCTQRVLIDGALRLSRPVNFLRPAIPKQRQTFLKAGVKNLRLNVLQRLLSRPAPPSQPLEKDQRVQTKN